MSPHTRHLRTLILTVILGNGGLWIVQSAGAPRTNNPSAARQDPRPKDATNFTHRKHVPKAWMARDDEGEWSFQERQRDCRGCHNYEKEGAHDPQTVCTQCHFNNDTNQYTFTLWADPPSFTKDLTGLRSPGAFFQHNYHLVLECRECHQVSEDEFLPPILMPGARDKDSCRTCHEGDKPRQKTLMFMTHDREENPIDESRREEAMSVLKKNLLTALNQSPSMGANIGGKRFVEPFRHEDHVLIKNKEQSFSLAELKEALVSVKTIREGNCGACHATMFQAQDSTELQAGVHMPFEQHDQSCGTCHVSDAAGTPIQFKLNANTLTSVTAGTFSHATHLNFERPQGDPVKSSATGYDVIEAEGCLACHEWNNMLSEEFSLRGALADPNSFKGCQDCHTTAAWAPIDHGSWWTPRDHGDWSSCETCHDPEDRDFAANRPQAQVQRRPSGLFSIDTHAHPLITVAEGEELSGSCSECHRRPVKELPSNIKNVAFSHESHLPPGAGPEACSNCHSANLALSDRSGDLGALIVSGHDAVQVPEDQLGLIYDPAACSDCHLGSDPTPQFGPESVASANIQKVPEFSHAMHLGKALNGGGVVDCTNCHTPQAKARVGTLPAALDCTLCHDHADTAIVNHSPALEGGISPNEVAACNTCHQGGLSELEQRSLLTTLSIDDLIGNVAQHHDLQRECKECHLPESAQMVSQVSAPTNSRLFAERTFYRSERSAIGSPEIPAIHRNGTRKFGEDTNCFYCHWTNLLSSSTAGGTPTGDPETDVARRDYGNRLSDFPGGPRRP
ncbi:MAG TPA: hypothetical protein EYG26_14830 [Planctomycetes bacterium]|nr:hypothetical protein [Planctomycetota bacterium]